MNKKLNILSLFDGMSTLQLALKNVGIPVNNYYASEIKPYAIKLTQHHFPNTIQLGDVTKWKEWDIDWGSIDLIGSGSPCQDLSIAGKRKGITGERSSLFFVFVDILNHVRKFNHEVKFLQENVASASGKDINIMSKALGTFPQMIDSKLFVPQSRKRLYWSNIKTCRKGLFSDLYSCFDIPEKREDIKLNDILINAVSNRNFGYALLERYYNGNKFLNKSDEKSQIKLMERYEQFKFNLVYDVEKKINRLLNQTEMERLQGFPDGYTKILTVSQASSILGDAWTLPVIEMIMEQYKKVIECTDISCA